GLLALTTASQQRPTARADHRARETLHAPTVASPQTRHQWEPACALVRTHHPTGSRRRVVNATCVSSMLESSLPAEAVPRGGAEVVAGRKRSACAIRIG